MRRTERFPVNGSNSLWQMYRIVPFRKVFRNVIVAEVGRFIPFFSWKNALYRRLLGMQVGEQTAFAFKVTVDLLYPERIKVGRNTIIGYNTTLLTHEYLVDEYRVGDVEIGDSVMIGANSTLLPGIRIGDGAVVGAASLVNRDIPPGAFAAGNPVRIIREPKKNR
ncbi:MAG: acyltransferase [Firmicutes bacterium]|uniref:Acetyltransferase (Isoleucine patch superfamily) n=1 Tax=Melghirimyces thermohalophilus TaxID=1236220 RepID=A0A1G6I1V8_9BACL|nr:acyltransferase [Melghirimyces thermohalophilus]MDA8352186.1 acyltransferase [Bacillota bacterium]SDC00522.1 Acetyltransferase (isoleucine patch superfamily) [Melghirimyces thermohalophilus]